MAASRPRTMPATTTTPADVSFAELGLPPVLVDVLHSAGILKPFPIQGLPPHGM